MRGCTTDPRSSAGASSRGSPAVVLCDEVTGNLDSGTGDDIMQLMRTLNNEEGKTFVLITHDPVVAQSTDRLVTLHDGEIIGEKRVW